MFSLTDQRISRRALLGGAAAGAAALTLPGRAFAANTKITQFVWTGAQEIVPRRIADEYVAAHPDVEIEIVAGLNAQTYPRIKASLDIDADDPLMNFGFFNMDATEKGRRDNVWLPLDPAEIPNLNSINPAFRDADEMGAFFCMDVGGILYNKDLVKTPPTSWLDLWDEQYKGKVAFFDSFWAGNGLIATARLLGGGEDNVEPAMQRYEEAAKSGQIHSLFTSNAQLLQLLASGEVLLAPYFRGIALPWQAQGAPIGYAAPKEGQIAFPEGFQLIRGTSEEKQKICNELINISLSPERVAEYCREAAVVPLVEGVEMPSELADDPAISPQAIEEAIKPDYARVVEDSAKWSDEWNRRVKANL